ncbi:hypothetical protein F4809DRAFT_445523 [Biscogniauxia mediterranea]|nr:hypothetical protein F4809DRAFT_445523 [Biscogniauxia mediterranea]
MTGRNWQNNNAGSRVADATATRTGPSAQQRQRNDESWVEVCSHPSSSSVSSIGDEIVTTGLQVGSSYGARRRRLHPQSYAQPSPQQPAVIVNKPGQAGTSSSQEEYDESESEEEHVLTSSTENITRSQATPNPQLRQHNRSKAVESDSSDDDDENATALGRRPPEPFRPQPNAFSHPPSHLTHRHSTTSAIPQTTPRPSFSQRSNTRIDRRSPNFMSPNYQADNDAALRASLTTLLSCAAAARGLPKDGEKEMGGRAGPATSNRPVEMRFVPESELMGPSPPQAAAQAQTQTRAQQQAQTQARRPTQPTRNNQAAPSSREVAGEKIKRSGTPISGTKSRATKKKRTVVGTGEDALISPSLMTWVVSAGVVVLVSVVGFGAGYVIGREVGRQESLSSLGGAGNASAVADGGSCGREVIRSGGGTLRKFRWGSGMGRSIVA